MLAAIVAVALAVWLVPWTRARVTAAATVTEALGLAPTRPFAPTITVETDRIARTMVDVYSPGEDAPPVIFVPGAAPAGRGDSRVERLAHVFATAGRTVVVPELTVYEERLVPADVERLVAIAGELSDQDHGVVFLGFSFGGSLALVAAADPRLDGRVEGVATFGAYADLIGVVQAATTGVAVVDQQRFAWDADPRAEEVVQEELTSLLPEGAAQAVRSVLNGDGRADELEAAERAVYDLLANEDPERTYQLADELAAPMQDRVAEVSPVAVAQGLHDVPIVAMHSRNDPVIPYGELRRLGEAVPHARLLTIEGLGHAQLELTEPQGWVGAIDDLWATWSFAGRVVQWQEPTWPWGAG